MELRQAGVTLPIVVLAGNYHQAEQLLQQNHLEPVIFRHEVLDALEASMDRNGDPLAVHVKVDTGMGRLGCALSEVESLVDRVQRSPLLFSRCDESFLLGPAKWDLKQRSIQ